MGVTEEGSWHFEAVRCKVFIGFMFACHQHPLSTAAHVHPTSALTSLRDVSGFPLEVGASVSGSLSVRSQPHALPHGPPRAVWFTRPLPLHHCLPADRVLHPLVALAMPPRTGGQQSEARGDLVHICKSVLTHCQSTDSP